MANQRCGLAGPDATISMKLLDYDEASLGRELIAFHARVFLVPIVRDYIDPWFTGTCIHSIVDVYIRSEIKVERFSFFCPRRPIHEEYRHARSHSGTRHETNKLDARNGFVIRGDVVMHRGKVVAKRIASPTLCQSVFLENCRGNLFSTAACIRFCRPISDFHA